MLSPFRSHVFDQKVLVPIKYLFDTYGKDFEPSFVPAINHWLKAPKEKVKIIADTIKLLRDSSLLVDDIQDGGTIRKGIPSVHCVYGVGLTLNAANLGYFIVLDRILSLNQPKAAELFAKQLIDLHRGQGIDIHWRDNFICPTEDEYKEMVIYKATPILKLGVGLMQFYSDCKEDFSPFIETLGLYNQIRDDYCNFVLPEHVDRSGFCADLTEGKFGFPIRHAIEINADDGQLLNILKQKTNDIEMKRYCVSLLDKVGSLAYTRDVLSDLDRQARDFIKKLGGNPYLTAELDKMLNWQKGVTNL